MAHLTRVRRGSAVSSTTNSTSWTPTFSFTGTNGLNTAIASGERVMWVLFVATDGNPTITETGVSATNRGGANNSTVVGGQVFTFETTTAFAAGAHPAFVISSTVSEQFSASLFAYKAAASATIGVIMGSHTNGSSTNSDPASFTNNSGASRDFSVVVGRAGDSTVVATAAPTNYGNLISQAGGGTSGASSNAADRQLTVANTVAEDPGTFTSASEQWVCSTVALYEIPGAASMPADPGTYALTGTAANLAQGHAVTADPGTYSLTGTAASLAKGRTMAADPGTYSLTGTAAALTLGTSSLLSVYNWNATSVEYRGGGKWRVEKTSNNGTWEGSAISDYALTGDFEIGVYSVNPSDSFFLGVNDAPKVTTGYGDIDYSIVWSSSTSGGANRWEVWSNGGMLAAIGGSSTDTAWVWRIGSTIYFGLGSTLAAAKASPSHSVGSVSTTFYLDSTILSVGTSFDVSLAEPAASTTLAADPGIYSLTGTAVLFHRAIVATPGSYTLTGTAANLLRNRAITADPGSYAITGTTAGLLVGRSIVATAGSYALTGTAAGLSAQRLITAGAGSYLITGADAGLSKSGGSVTMPADVGSYALTGTGTSLLAGRALSADPGAYAMAGEAVSFLIGRVMTAAVGSYSITGTGASLTIAAGDPWQVEPDPPPTGWEVEDDPDLADDVGASYSAEAYDPLYYETDSHLWEVEEDPGPDPVVIEPDPVDATSNEGAYSSLFYDPSFYDTTVRTWVTEDGPPRVAILEET